MSAIDDATLRACLDEWCRHERSRTITHIQTPPPSASGAIQAQPSEQIKRDGEIREIR
jgi:hypothetical protein